MAEDTARPTPPGHCCPKVRRLHCNPNLIDDSRPASHQATQRRAPNPWHRLRWHRRARFVTTLVPRMIWRNTRGSGRAPEDPGSDAIEQLDTVSRSCIEKGVAPPDGQDGQIQPLNRVSVPKLSGSVCPTRRAIGSLNGLPRRRYRPEPHGRRLFRENSAARFCSHHGKQPQLGPNGIAMTHSQKMNQRPSGV